MGTHVRISAVAAVVLLALGLSQPAGSAATTHYVAPAGSHVAPFTSWATAATNIQAAIDAAAAEDTVVVTNGIYLLESEILIAKPLMVQSANGSKNTIIDGHNQTRCVRITTNNAWFADFTVRNGAADTAAGGGIYNAGGVVYRCDITHNYAGDTNVGGGVYCTAGGRVEFSSVLYNSSSVGPLYLDTNCVAQSCLVAYNSAGTEAGGLYAAAGAAARSCIIRDNFVPKTGSGGGAVLDGGLALGCTIVRNEAGVQAGGLLARNSAVVINSIAWSNVAPADPNASADGNSSITYTDSDPLIPAEGNQASEPGFVDWTADDFHLTDLSPCLDEGGDMPDVTTDYDGNPRPRPSRAGGKAMQDMGALEYYVVEPYQPPVLAVTPGSLSNSVLQGLNATSLTFDIWNTNGSGEMCYRIQSTVEWALPMPTQDCTYGNTVNQHSLDFDTANLPSGHYDGLVMVNGQGTDGQPQYVPVTLTVEDSGPVIDIICTNPALTLAQGTTSLVERTLSVVNTGSGTLNYTITSDVPWLVVQPGSGSSSGTGQEHAWRVNPAGLEAGDHQAWVEVTAAGAVNSPMLLGIALSVTPALDCDTDSLENTVQAGTTPPEDYLHLWNSGGTGDVPFTIQADGNWFSVTNLGAGAGGTSVLEVIYLADVLPPGLYDGSILIVPEEGEEQTVVLHLTINAAAGQFSEKIVFDSDRDGNHDLWMMDPDGSNVEKLIEKAGAQTRPRLSPDGTKIAFYDGSSGGAVPTVRDLVTGAETLLSNLGSFEWARDSRGLIGPWFYHTDTGMDLWYADLASGGMEVCLFEPDRQNILAVLPSDGTFFYTTDPLWWPDTSIKKYNPNTSNRTLLAVSDGRMDWGGAVSPDGRLLAFLKSNTGDLGTSRAFIMNSDGTSERRLTADLGTADEGVWFAPDSRNAVFSRFVGGSTWAIGKLPVGGGAEAVLLQEDHILDNPVWGRLYIPTVDPASLGVSILGVSAFVTCGVNAASETFTVRNVGAGTMTYTISNNVPWLLTQPATGVSTGEYDTITNQFCNGWLGRDSAVAGVHTGRMFITYGTNFVRTLPLELTTWPPTGNLGCSLNEIENQVIQSNNAVTWGFYLWNNGSGGYLDYSSTASAPWLTLNPVAGSCASTEQLVYITFPTSALGLGIHTGRVTIVAESPYGLNVATQVVTVTMTVLPNPGDINPALRVSANTVAGYALPGEKARPTFQVWNGGGRSLDYTLTDDRDWLSLRPTSGYSIGERDTITCEMNTEGLTSGDYTGTILVNTGIGESETINAELHIGGGYPLIVQTNMPYAGSVTVLTPPNAGGGLYSRGTVVRVRATPATSDYLFLRWVVNGAAAGSATELTVTMNGTQTVLAEFQPYTTISGRITNLVTGTGLTGARVELGAYSTLSQPGIPFVGIPSGLYWLPNLPCGVRGDLRVTLDGFDPVTLPAVAPECYEETPINVGLRPNFFRNVQAWQNFGTRQVVVRYNLIAPSGLQPRVTLGIQATVGGVTYNYPALVTGVSGDANVRVAAGSGRQILWDMDSYPRMPGVVTNAVITLRADGAEAQTAPFRFDNSQANSWLVRVWIDRFVNGVYDPGEEVANAEVYYGGRTDRSRAGWTDSQGYLRINQWAEESTTLFARKKVHNEPARKSGHGGVSNLMFSLWYDSDIGGARDSNWDGVWRSYTLNTRDMAAVSAGQPIYLRMAHPIFEWHLICAFEHAMKPADAFWVSKLTNDLRAASTYLYDITDGQMKLGMLYLTGGVQNGFTTWNNADLVCIYPGLRAHARIGGILGDQPAAYGTNRWAHMWFGWDLDAPTVIHEFGHYAFALHDEYIDGMWDEVAWPRYRARNPDKTPFQYGLMDNQWALSEMSSFNDYMYAYYTSTLRATQTTAQAWQYYRQSAAAGLLRTQLIPSWTQVWTNYCSNPYSGYYVDLVTPQYGYFYGRTTVVTTVGSRRITNLVDQATSMDRPGPTNIPAPYSVCTFLPVTYGRLAAGEPSAPARVQVRRNGQPVAGARVALRGTHGRRLDLGQTGRDGWAPAQALEPGDRLEAWWRGAQASHTAAQPEPGPVWTLDLPADPGTDPSRRAAQGSFADFGALASGYMETPTTFRLNLEVNQPLLAVPDVQATLYGGDPAAVAMTAVDDYHYTGLLDLSSAIGGTLAIACLTADGRTNRTLDAFTFNPVFTNEVNELTSSDNQASLYAPGGYSADSVALLYQGYAPVIWPEGFGLSNQVGAALFVTVPAGLTDATLAWHYDDADVAGLDVTTLALYQWDAAASNWVAQPCGISPERRVLTAQVTDPGVLALFAEASPDVIPPAAISNLLATPAFTPKHVQLTWTAPGDDDMTGSAMVYRLRFSTAPIAATNWDEATEYPLDQAPAVAGTDESVTVVMPDMGQAYYFALRAQDEAGNLADLSNVQAARAPIDDANGDGLSDQYAASVGTSDPFADLDRDGLTTYEESWIGTDASNPDTDGDGMNDKWEHDNGLDPLKPDADDDLDGDTLTNIDEYHRSTNPASKDTDGDGMTDPWEIEKALDPLCPFEDQGADADPDTDRSCNYDEYVADTDPLDPASYFAVSALSWASALELNFISSTRRIYQVDQATNRLPEAHWSMVPDPGSFYGHGGEESVILSNNTGFIFYRLRVNNPE